MKTGDFCCWPDSAVRLAQEYDRFLGYSGHTATAAAWPSLTQCGNHAHWWSAVTLQICGSAKTYIS
jgi:hypothetical protein